MLRVFIARTALVDQVLHDRRVQHRQRHEAKTDRDPCDWFEVNAALMQQGQQTMLHERNKNNATDLAGNTISE